MDSAQPIIVKRIKKAAHGHHGGAWKVAFADFVTAMMAFFLLMWLMGSTTQSEREAIGEYFENPSAIQGPGGTSTSMIKLGSTDNNQNTEGSNDSQSVEKQSRTEKLPEVAEAVEVVKDKQRLDSLKQVLESAIDASTALKPFKEQLLLDITAEGLRIQIIDKENRPMFDSGSSRLKDYTATILLEFGKLINNVPNKISLTGHTDATPFISNRGYTNWELSTDRANSSRRALVLGGLNRNKIAKVVGLSSTVLFDKSKPNSPINRRISMIVLNRQAEQALIGDAKLNVSSKHGLKSALIPPKPALLGLIKSDSHKSPLPSKSRQIPSSQSIVSQSIASQSGSTQSESKKASGLKRPVTLLKLPNKKSLPRPKSLSSPKKLPIEPIRLPISIK